LSGGDSGGDSGGGPNLKLRGKLVASFRDPRVDRAIEAAVAAVEYGDQHATLSAEEKFGLAAARLKSIWMLLQWPLPLSLIPKYFSALFYSSSEYPGRIVKFAYAFPRRDAASYCAAR
jgi:hypothetical protein